jgi:hypothetical protein
MITEYTKIRGSQVDGGNAPDVSTINRVQVRLEQIPKSARDVSQN